MAGPGDPAALPGAVFLAVLLAWIVIPLGLAIIAFRRRSL
jgi:ABC-type transport system involved in multi-copper enzyme maturation permease subunit